MSTHPIFAPVAVACLLVAVLVSMPAEAATPVPPSPRLPVTDIAALASSRERLFVGAFDGGLFVMEKDGGASRLEDAAVSRHINALAWDERQLALWIGTARGLARCAFSPRPTCTRVGDGAAVHAVLVRRDGTVVTGGDAGLAFVDASGSETTFGRKQGAPFRSVWALAESDDGELFVGTTNGLFWGEGASFTDRRASTLKRAALVDGHLPDDWVTALAVDADRLYVGTYNAGLVAFRRAGRDLVSSGADASFGYVNPAGILLLGDGALAVATMDGLHAGPLGQAREIATLGRDVTAVVRAPGSSGFDGYWIATRRGVQWLQDLASKASALAREE